MSFAAALPLLALLTAQQQHTAAAALTAPNLNGAYKLADGSTFPTNFRDYPNGVESFDAYHGPINTTYGEVWWTTSTDQLPPEVVARFDNKVMAIVGYEMDQVRRTPDGKDISVPISCSYNHHHNTMIVGKHAKLTKVASTDPRVTSSARAMMLEDGVWLPEEVTPTPSGAPASAMFENGNGGEYRKTLHMTAPPFARLVDSPTKISGIAMQIDTWHRERMNISGGSPFVSGPVPRASLAPTTGPDALYSGLLECPITTRVEKICHGSCTFNDTQTLVATNGSTGFVVEHDVSLIFGRVAAPGQNSSDGNLVFLPAGASSVEACEAACTARLGDDGCAGYSFVSATYHQAAWRGHCYGARMTSGHGGQAPSHPDVGVTTGMRSHGGSACTHALESPEACFAAAANLPALRDGHVNIVKNRTTTEGEEGTTPPGCSVAMLSAGGAAGTFEFEVVFNSNASAQGNCRVGAASRLLGRQSLAGGAIGFNLELARGNATMTLTGPSDVWFAIGFGAQTMGDAPYTIVVEPAGGNGATTKVTERKLADHAPGTVLSTTSSSLVVISSSVAGGRRTVVLRRPVVGASPQHYTFQVAQIAIDLIAAVGTTPEFGPHGAAPHGPGTVNLWPAPARDADAKNTETSSSINICLCNIPAAPFGSGSGAYRTYVGGQSVCRHGWHLLDADQEVPWPDQPLIMYKKFRVYFQEYNKSRHIDVEQHDWGVGAGGNHDEYDVPQCAEGTATADKCRHNVTGTWMPIPAGGTPMYLASLHHHCHAPTCLRLDVFNNDTGELLCRAEPVYGGTGGYVSDKGSQFDEPGYVAIPPCIFGSPKHGLRPPPLMNGMTIRVVSTTNSTHGHHGEMALPQALLAKGPLPDLEGL